MNVYLFAWTVADIAVINDPNAHKAQSNRRGPTVLTFSNFQPDLQIFINTEIYLCYCSIRRAALPKLFHCNCFAFTGWRWRAHFRMIWIDLYTRFVSLFVIVHKISSFIEWFSTTDFVLLFLFALTSSCQSIHLSNSFNEN